MAPVLLLFIVFPPQILAQTCSKQSLIQILYHGVLQCPPLRKIAISKFQHCYFNQVVQLIHHNLQFLFTMSISSSRNINAKLCLHYIIQPTLKPSDCIYSSILQVLKFPLKMVYYWMVQCGCDYFDTYENRLHVILGLLLYCGMGNPLMSRKNTLFKYQFCVSNANQSRKTDGFQEVMGSKGSIKAKNRRAWSTMGSPWSIMAKNSRGTQEHQFHGLSKNRDSRIFKPKIIYSLSHFFIPKAILLSPNPLKP